MRLLVNCCSMVQLLAVVSLLTLYAQSGNALRCFVCSSTKDPSCKDPFNKEHNYHKLAQCTQDSMRNINDVIPGIFSNFNYQNTHSEDFACVKAVIREHGREQEVIRSCTIPRADTFDVCSQLKSRDLAFCRACSGDSCNAADGAAPRSLLLTLLPALALGLSILTNA